MNKLRIAINTVLGLGLIGGGTGLLMWFVATRPEPPRHTAPPRTTEVETLAIRPRTYAAPIIGHGNVRPRKQVRIVPNVSGKIIYTHPDLAEGKTITQGERLFEIDPEVYQARVDAAGADVRRLQAIIRRQQQEAESLTERVKLAARMTAIAEEEFRASKKLEEDQAVAGVMSNADEVKYLRQQEALLDLRNRQDTIPFLLEESQAQLDVARAKLEQAEYDLQNTKIDCPFDARVDAVSARTTQFVNAFISIATLTDLEAFEIPAVVDPRDLQWIDEQVAARAMGTEGDDPGPAVTVRWTLYGQAFQWSGHVTRFERLDEATRTARIVVEVRDVELGFHMSPDSGKPPISLGMFCRTEIPGRKLDRALVVPRGAVYEDQYVYVFEPDADAPDGRSGRLGRRRVPTLRSAGDEVLVRYDQEPDDERAACELAAGEQVIISPLTKPVVGMRLRLREMHAQADERASDPDAAPRVVLALGRHAVINP